MIMDHVRVPREDMFNRFVNLDKEGNFKVVGDLRVIYGVMMLIRLHIVVESPSYLAAALKIGVRYAVCRRQFKTMHGSKAERKLMDYQSHMVKFGPILAKCYAMLANITYVKSLFTEMMTKIN